MDIRMGAQLTGLRRCPHCGVAQPTIIQVWREDAPRKGASDETDLRVIGRAWALYFCTTCGRPIVAGSYPFSRNQHGHPIPNRRGEAAIIFPAIRSIDESLPESARRYLMQAIETVHAPDGSVMLSASAVDAMLKGKGYSDGTLYARIEQATKDHLLTRDMATWAHRVRLDANDPRHADEERPHLDTAQAEQVIQFTTALAEILYVLPARVSAGITAAKETEEKAGEKQ